MNWKEKANNVLDNHLKKWEEFLDQEGRLNDEWIIDAMLDFAKLACEEQKKICADNATIQKRFEFEGEVIEEDTEIYMSQNSGEIYFNTNNILDAPTVNFEENEKSH